MYEHLIRIDKNGIANRVPVPENIWGFPDYIYLDLSFLSPEAFPDEIRLSKWFPGVNGDWPLGVNKKYSDQEVLTPDYQNLTVVITHPQIDLTAAEIKARDEQLAAQHEAEQVIARQHVDDEASRRIYLGFIFQNHPIAYRSTDRTEILSNAQIAFMAIVGGAQPGDLRWADDDHDFNYIAADNTLIPMDAGTAAELHRVASARRRQIMLAARELKIKYEVPLDYMDDKWWP